MRNVIDFGAFVDIGVHQDGLVHISQICDKFIKHPREVLKVGDVVQVKVLDVDVKKKRISLTCKGCGNSFCCSDALRRRGPHKQKTQRNIAPKKQGRPGVFRAAFWLCKITVK